MTTTLVVLGCTCVVLSAVVCRHNQTASAVQIPQQRPIVGSQPTVQAGPKHIFELDVNDASTVIVLTSADRRGATHLVDCEVHPLSRSRQSPASCDVLSVSRADCLPLHCLGDADSGTATLSLKTSSGATIALPDAAHHLVRKSAAPAVHEDAEGGQQAPPSGARRAFLVPKFHNSRAANVPEMAVKLAEGRRVAVFASHVSESATSQQLADGICRICNQTQLIEHVEQLIYSLADVDGDGRLSIVLSTLDDRVGADPSDDSAEPVRGCVRSADWLRSTGDFSGDVIYLDQRVSVDDRLVELLAHELAHAAVCSRWVCRDGESVVSELPVPGWLNEAIAHTVEQRLTGLRDNFEPRRLAFMADSGRCPIMPARLLASLAMRRAGPRAAATSFVESLLSQGVALSELSDAPSGAIGLIEARTQKSFATLLRTWSSAVAAQACYPQSDGSTGPMQIPTVESGRSAQFCIQGTAMMCLRPSVTPCRVRVVTPATTQLSAVRLTD